VLPRKLSKYVGDPFYDFGCVSVETVNNIIYGLKLDKASGSDTLTAYHLKNCHHSVVIIIVKLFRVMIVYNYVPNDFGNGVTIPIPKDSKKGTQSHMEGYRGITISPSFLKFLKFLYRNV